ncbi:unnamed protein product [Rhizopus microsporus]
MAPTKSNNISKETKEEKEVEEKKEKEQTSDHDELDQETKQESQDASTNDYDNKKEQQQQQQQDPSVWTPVWDDNAKAYYWWNTSTNETTWVNPNVTAENQEYQSADNSNFLLDPETRKNLEAGEELTEEEKLQSYMQASQAYTGQYYPSQDYSMYTSQAFFNARTGRFTTAEDANRLNPENLSIENRATRQMQFYFDVDAYTEQRNRQRMMEKGTKRKLTRKEIEYFKKMKQEKKNKRAREWLLQ